MTRTLTKAAAVIPAPPERVYAVLSNYRDEHPHILPKDYFSDLLVEQGGQGAGTVFRVTIRVFGTQRSYHMLVSEPEPGVLIETDQDSGLETRFTVTPAETPGHSRVQIATDWEASSGFAGWIERLTTPPIMRTIYTKQLVQLADYVQRKPETERRQA